MRAECYDGSMSPADLNAEAQARLAFWTRFYAKRRGLSINGLIRKADLSTTAVYGLLRCDANPTLATLATLASVLGVEIVQLLQPTPEEAS